MTELENPEIFRTVVDVLRAGVCLVDRNRRIVFWNNGAELITGYLRHEVVGHFCSDNILRHCDEKGCGLCGASCPLAVTMLEGKAREAHVFLRHKTGHRIPVHLRAAPIRDASGHVIGTVQNFDELNSDGNESYLTAYGCWDEMTGVPNHWFTQSHLRESLATFNECHVPFGLLRVQVRDLHRFEATSGREAAELILREVAQTIRNFLDPGGFVGRWDESEFLVIVRECDRREVQRAGETIQKIVRLSEIQWWNNSLSVEVSVAGTTLQPGDTMESLLNRARPDVGIIS